MSVIQRAVLASLYICIVLSLSCLVVIHSGCIQDTIHYDHVPKRNIDYKLHVRHKREVQGEESVYKRMRIHLQFSLDAEPLPDDVKARLKQSVQRAADFMSNVLSVVPVQGRLLLARNGCLKSWASGPNMGKCSTMDGSYDGRELCGKGEDAVLIPASHLEGLSVYNTTSEQPIQTYYPNGEGVDADFIMYITAITRRSCLTQGVEVLAFARYCQQDQFDRPIAAMINFCPFALKNTGTTGEKIYLTAIHEFIHSLGFTSDLFNSYKQCQIQNDTLSCTQRLRVIETVLSTRRIATPAVSQASSGHFGCTLAGQNFGVVIETMGNSIGSHWDAAFMQGSVMTTSIKKPHLTSIDNITLALFEDMGWYHVDYSYADHFLWGKGAGCNFGLKTTCHQSDHYFCLGSGAGCHYLHTDKGVCKTDQPLAGCRIFTALQGSECFLSDNTDSTSHLYGEVYNETSRCFLSNLTKNGASGLPKQINYEGRCFQHRCNGSDSLQVQLLDSDWLDCPFESTIQIPGYNGTLLCPKQGILCLDPLPQRTTMPLVTTTAAAKTTTQITGQLTTEPSTKVAVPTTPYPTTPSTLSPVRAEITFKDMDYTTLQSDVQLKQDFQQAVISQVIQVTQIDVSQIANILLQSGSVLVIFDILPSTDSSAPSPAEVLDTLSTYISAGNLTVDLYDGQQTFTASALREIDTSVEPQTPFPSGAIAGMVLGGCLLLTAVVIFFVLINKYKNRGRISPTSSRAGSVPPQYVVDTTTDNTDLPVTQTEKRSRSDSTDSIRSMPCLIGRQSHESLAMDVIKNGAHEIRKRTSSVDSHLDKPPPRPVSTQGVMMSENGDSGFDTNTMSI